MEDLKKQISDLDQDDFMELKLFIDELYLSAKDEMDKKRAEKMMREISLGDEVVFLSGNKELTGTVIQMSMDKVQLAVEGRERAAGMSYERIIRKA